MPPRACDALQYTIEEMNKVFSFKMSYYEHPLVDHFTIGCVVAWPLNESEAGVELYMKCSEVSIKIRSIPASLSFKGPATKYRTVKWSTNLYPVI